MIRHRRPTKAEAEGWLDQQVELVQEGKAPQSGRAPTVAEFAEHWLANVSLNQAKGKSSPPGPNTLGYYLYKHRNYFVRPYGRHSLAEIQRDHIEVLFQWLGCEETARNHLGLIPGIRLARQPLKAHTLRHFHHLINHLFKDAE